MSSRTPNAIAAAALSDIPYRSECKPVADNLTHIYHGVALFLDELGLYNSISLGSTDAGKSSSKSSSWSFASASICFEDCLFKV